MANRSTTITPTTVTVAQRKGAALELRTLGLNYREVYEMMRARYPGDLLPSTYDERYVWRDIHDEMNRIRTENTETAIHVKVLELNRLDQLQAAIMSSAMRGDAKAVSAALKIMDHRAKLLGLYAPSQVKVNDWRTEILEMVKAGKISREDAEKELGEDLAREVFDGGSTNIIEGRFAEEEGSGETRELPGQVAREEHPHGGITGDPIS
jgi:hypothetical protein